MFLSQPKNIQSDIINNTHKKTKIVIILNLFDQWQLPGTTTFSPFSLNYVYTYRHMFIIKTYSMHMDKKNFGNISHQIL